MKAAFLAVALSLFPTAVFAQATGFYLPSSSPSYGQDEFRSSDGTSCRTTMDGTKRMEVGTFASGGSQTANSGTNYGLPGYVANPAQGNMGVYGKFSWSLDARPTRMDCNKLYELELEKKQIELELLKQQMRVAKQSMQQADDQLDDLKKQRPKARKASANVPPL
ncbi:MAG: hypothetical protein JWM36_826 [Hyphomicrobiales bacterium]|nr:hypothetical protein [Hyphomicrobiales bacterium]